MRDRQRGRDDGASAVEFALVLPLLIILVFGIISFGIVFAQKLALGNAARQAARYGVVQGRTCGDMVASAQGAANTISMQGSNTKVLISMTGANPTPCGPDSNYTSAEQAAQPCLGSQSNDEVTVRIRYDSTLTIPLVFSNPVFTIDGNGVFRCEFS
jgi:Flp pilus assembly protein TadG